MCRSANVVIKLILVYVIIFMARKLRKQGLTSAPGGAPAGSTSPPAPARPPGGGSVPSNPALVMPLVGRFLSGASGSSPASSSSRALLVVLNSAICSCEEQENEKNGVRGLYFGSFPQLLNKCCLLAWSPSDEKSEALCMFMKFYGVKYDVLLVHARLQSQQGTLAARVLPSILLPLQRQ